MNLKTINLFLVGLLFVFLTSCGGGSDNKNEGKTTDTTQQDEGKQPAKGETANNESSSTESTAKPAEGYVLISNQMGKVTVAQYKEGTVEQTKQMQMDLTKYGGELSFPKYNSANSYYTVQYNAAMDKFYVSMMSANMLQGTFDWFKFIEYSVKDGTSKEVASLKEQVHSWYYVESANKIIALLEEKMVSIDLASAKVDNIFTLNSMFSNMDFQLNGNSLVITGQNGNKEVIQFMVNVTSNQVERKKAGTMNDFSSVRNGKFIEIYKDGDSGGIRLYEGGEAKASTSFDFSNYNTTWINDNQFVAIGKGVLSLRDTQLQEMKKFEKKKIHVIDCLKNGLVVEYWEGETKKVALLDLNFEKLTDLSGVDSNFLIVARSVGK